MDRTDIECACGGKGGMHIAECPIVQRNLKPVEPTLEGLQQENHALREALGRYARAIDIAQRALANT